MLDDIPKSAIDIISENIELYRVLFQMKRESQIEIKLSELMAKNIQLVLKENNEVDDIPFRYFHSYVSGAMISIIKLWVLDEDRIPEDQLLESIAKLSLDGPISILINGNKNVR
ncbi:TetR-like C-terminal domain-containing protein [Oceanobacillus iheyensis]|uniref:TetR-like C-terminal domain-containing protein n=1 Tax=Oceanobacillus iheyensis TaxID=182710 RepID=UPI00363EAAFC